jgi:hypothetical protein
MTSLLQRIFNYVSYLAIVDQNLPLFKKEQQFPALSFLRRAREELTAYLPGKKWRGNRQDLFTLRRETFMVETLPKLEVTPTGPWHGIIPGPENLRHCLCMHQLNNTVHQEV